MKVSKKIINLETESAFAVLAKANKLISEGKDVINLGIEFSFFKKVVKSSFQRRRKMLRNALKNLNLQNKLDHDIFSKRAEELTTDDFIWLSKYLKN